MKLQSTCVLLEWKLRKLFYSFILDLIVPVDDGIPQLTDLGVVVVIRLIIDMAVLKRPRQILVLREDGFILALQRHDTTLLLRNRLLTLLQHLGRVLHTRIQAANVLLQMLNLLLCGTQFLLGVCDLFLQRPTFIRLFKDTKTILIRLFRKPLLQPGNLILSRRLHPSHFPNRLLAALHTCLPLCNLVFGNFVLRFEDLHVRLLEDGSEESIISSVSIDPSKAAFSPVSTAPFFSSNSVSAPTREGVSPRKQRRAFSSFESSTREVASIFRRSRSASLLLFKSPSLEDVSSKPKSGDSSPSNISSNGSPFVPSSVAQTDEHRTNPSTRADLFETAVLAIDVEEAECPKWSNRRSSLGKDILMN
ncbi:hypothetical protein E6O75_ATG02362 [Venturia nashicola]|uniref:Uncharacterized protein n=1 Tax=Venturia nashicola TaxID=86259 RepID=A0A4Z1P4W9_9PEZI|nr:hypothetical protein E6O75_ATG02362 [Venturia nashicola]